MLYRAVGHKSTLRALTRPMFINVLVNTLRRITQMRS